MNLPLLQGVRVLELTVAWAGPLAGRMLADLGADVIHVEYRTARGGVIPEGAGEDRAWRWGQLPASAIRPAVFPMNDPGARPWNRQAIFNKHNRNKRSLCADLKTDEGRQLFLDLARQADVVLDNYSPHVMTSLGIDHESLIAVNPRIVTVSMSGFGHSGPFSDRVSYGPILEAHSGLASLCGEEEAPLKLGAALPDAIGGLTGALAIAWALGERDETGEGQHIDLSQLEAYCAMGGAEFLAQSLDEGELGPSDWASSIFGVPHGCYRCLGDDAWVAVAVETDVQWASLNSLLAQEGLGFGPELDSFAGRRARASEISTRLSQWCAARTREEAFAQLQAELVPSFPVLSNAELFADPHLQQREMFVTYYQDDVGDIPWPAFPVRLGDGSDPARYSTAPALGADNESIVTGLCARSAAEFRRLVREQVLADKPLPG